MEAGLELATFWATAGIFSRRNALQLRHFLHNRRVEQWGLAPHPLPDLPLQPRRHNRSLIAYEVIPTYCSRQQPAFRTHPFFDGRFSRDTVRSDSLEEGPITAMVGFFAPMRLAKRKMAVLHPKTQDFFFFFLSEGLGWLQVACRRRTPGEVTC